MHIGIPAEIRGGETRVAATPETVKKFTAKGFHVGASIPDEEYQAAGATIVASAAELYGQSQIVLKVRGPEPGELSMMRKDAVLLGLLSPHQAEGIEILARHDLTAFAMEKLPRISRAQSVLSSQANIAGYKAVLMAANVYQKFFPMLMTAAGTVKAARVLVLGAGVAGLQAIATAKRLGAVIEAFDVRPVAKERDCPAAAARARSVRWTAVGKRTGRESWSQICRGSIERGRESASGNGRRVRS